MADQPAVGRIVHYVHKFGVHRPAIIVDVYGDNSVDLHVFTGAQNDPPGSYRDGTRADGTVAFVQHATQDEDTKAPYTFHWPERVQPDYLAPLPVIPEGVPELS